MPSLRTDATFPGPGASSDNVAPYLQAIADGDVDNRDWLPRHIPALNLIWVSKYASDKFKVLTELMPVEVQGLLDKFGILAILTAGVKFIANIAAIDFTAEIIAATLKAIGYATFIGLTVWVIQFAIRLYLLVHAMSNEEEIWEKKRLSNDSNPARQTGYR
ncbi:MAG: hypothetical protein LBB38_04425 [Puniceicoccales bacterium]|jgi:hypothetical protein|nr:hypothetical protein [Puniceicoccales bacterium]